MANTVTITKLLDGPRNAAFHIYLKSDGSSGELSSQVLIDPTTSVSPALPAGATFTITEIWYSNVGFDSLLSWDASSSTAAWKIPAASDSNHISFDNIGGIKDRSGSGATGKLVISTNGFTEATKEGTMIIKVRKD